MHSKTKAKAKIIGLGLISGLMSAAAMAEPPIQPGDTLQSLSQVKITTTVNGQQGSIQELVASGQVRIADAAAQQASIALGEPAPAGAQPLDAAQANQAAVDAMAPAELNNTQAANAHLGTDQANPAAQDAQSALNPKPAETEMQAPANTAAAAPILSSSSAAPVNAEAPANSDSMSGAAPELPDANAAAEASPETPVSDTAIQASPEMPQAPAEAVAQ